MLQLFFSRFLWFIFLLLVQVLIFNHILLFNYALPLPYIFLLLILPAATPRWLYLLTGFLLGLSIDLFNNTPGLAAASMTFLGLTTPWFLQMYTPKDFKNDDNLLPSINSLERGPFIRYALTATFFYCLIFFSIEAFNFFDLKTWALKIICSSVLTFLLILSFEFIRKDKKKEGYR